MARLTNQTLAQSTAITPTTLIHIVTTADTSQNFAGSSYKAQLGQLAGLFSGYAFTGNTSANCINQLYVSDIYGCTGTTFHDRVCFETIPTGTTGYTLSVNEDGCLILASGATIIENIETTIITFTESVTGPVIEATTELKGPSVIFTDVITGPDAVFTDTVQSPTVVATNSVITPNMTVFSDVNVGGNVNAQNGNVTNDMNVGGNGNITNNMNVGGNGNITNDMNVGGNVNGQNGNFTNIVTVPVVAATNATAANVEFTTFMTGPTAVINDVTSTNVQVTDTVTTDKIQVTDTVTTDKIQVTDTVTTDKINSNQVEITDKVKVSRIKSNSPLLINDEDEGNVYFGSSSGVTIDVINNRIGINDWYGVFGDPNAKLDIYSTGETTTANIFSDTNSATTVTVIGVTANNQFGPGGSNIAIQATTSGSLTNDFNIAIKGVVAGGPNDYAIQLIDGQEGVGKVLTCVLPTGEARWEPISAVTSGSTFSGGSGNCITDLYVSNLYGCSPITVHNGIRSSGSTTNNAYSISFGENATTSATEVINVPTPITVISGCSFTLSDPDYSLPAVILSGDVSTEWTTYLSTFCSEFLLSGSSGTEILNAGCVPYLVYYDGVSLTYIVDVNTTLTGSTYDLISGNTFYNLPTTVDRPSFALGKNVTASGIFSHAEGLNTTASGIYSHTEGRFTTASGDYSHAEGEFNFVNGYSSHGEGNGNVASGDYSHAEGYSNNANGFASHVEGLDNITNGSYSHAEGQLNITYGDYSHAEGANTITYGSRSHAEGSATITSGNSSHAEGKETRSVGPFSHAEGLLSRSIGENSHAEGYDTRSYGNASHTEGYQTNTYSRWSHAEGYATTNIIGNLFSGAYSGDCLSGLITLGSSYGNVTSQFNVDDYLILGSFNISFFPDTNVYKISSVSWDGTNTKIQLYDITVNKVNIYVGNINKLKTYSWNGNVTVTGSTATHSEGIGSRSIGPYSHSEGSSISFGEGSHAEGDYSFSVGNYSHAEGIKTFAGGNYSHSEGSGTTTIGNYSHAEGDNTTASGTSSHAEGSTTQAIGDYSHAEGYLTFASGTSSHAEGLYTIASGTSSHAEGSNTIAGNLSSHAEGDFTIASGPFSHAEGASTEASGIYSHSEGSGTFASGISSHAEGYLTFAAGDYSHTEGSGTTASGVASHAGGGDSIANGNYSFVHGSNSVANGNNTTVFGNNITGNTDNTLYVNNISILSGATNGYVLTSDGSGNASWQASTGGVVGATTATTTTINFTGQTIYYNATSPGTGNITDDLTNAKLGVIQKIYHNDVSEPTYPVGWVLMGDAIYFTSTLNIIYAEWAGGTRVEYWYVQEQ